MNKELEAIVNTCWELLDGESQVTYGILESAIEDAEQRGYQRGLTAAARDADICAMSLEQEFPEESGGARAAAASIRERMEEEENG